MKAASYLTLDTGPRGESFTSSVPTAPPQGQTTISRTLQTGSRLREAWQLVLNYTTSGGQGWDLNPDSGTHSHYSTLPCSRTLSGSPLPTKCSTDCFRGPHVLVST